MNMRRSFGALVGAVALSVSLVACGGGSGTPDLAEMRDEFVGTWELVSMETESTTYDEDDVASMAEAGMLVTLDLDEGGDLIYNELGTQHEGTWSVESEDALELDIAGSTIDVPYANDQLTLDVPAGIMTFEKASDTPNMDRQPEDNAGGALTDEEDQKDDEKDVDDSDSGDTDLGELADRFTDEAIVAQDLYVMDIEKTADLDVTMADDETARIVVTGIGTDFEGDTGYMLTIENRSDQDLYIENIATELDGEDVYDYATVARVIKAGETADAFLFFDSSVCTVTEDSSCYFAVGLFDIDANIVAAYEATI